ncbi:MAG: SET domain-containing protein-lysine N-methyltransferase [Holophagaceae bacterium]|nr:SET domain-containing protein-lysine N-methyltransferase [Holophagaceae bacterium]
MSPGNPLSIKISDWPERDLVRVQASAIHGTGAFAKGPISRGTRIIEYKGQRCCKADLLAAAERGERQLTYVLNLDEELAIDGAVAGNEARFLNHSCAPNCEVIIFGGMPHLYALQDILEGAELTFDYQLQSPTGRRLSRALSRELFPCHCGAQACRGTLVALRGRPARATPRRPAPSVAPQP